MKKVLLILSMVLLIPNAALAAAPAADAPVSAWASWFKNLRRPARKDLLTARQYVRSQWGCMTGRVQCSTKKKYALRALATAITTAAATGIGVGAKAVVDHVNPTPASAARAAARAYAEYINNKGYYNKYFYSRYAKVAAKALRLFAQTFPEINKQSNSFAEKFEEYAKALDQRRRYAALSYSRDAVEDAVAAAAAAVADAAAAAAAAVEDAAGTASGATQKALNALAVVLKEESSNHWNELADALEAMAREG